MNALPSAKFRTTFHKLTEATEVTVSGHVIGRWTPAVGPFEPEHAGKMDFYLNLLNDTERGDGDQPSIGIILCAEKDDVEVEYALRTKANPIGVAAYQLQPKLPAALKGKLPTAKQLADVIRAVLPV